jgi:hypothetical protein
MYVTAIVAGRAAEGQETAFSRARRGTGKPHDAIVAPFRFDGRSAGCYHKFMEAQALRRRYGRAAKRDRGAITAHDLTKLSDERGVTLGEAAALLKRWREQIWATLDLYIARGEWDGRSIQGARRVLAQAQYRWEPRIRADVESYIAAHEGKVES